MYHFSVDLFILALVIVLLSIGAVVALRCLDGNPHSTVEQQPTHRTDDAPQPLAVAGER